MHINDLIETLKKMGDLPVFIGGFKQPVNLITFIYKDGVLTKHQIAITFTKLKGYKPLKSSEIVSTLLFWKDNQDLTGDVVIVRDFESDHCYLTSDFHPKVVKADAMNPRHIVLEETSEANRFPIIHFTSIN